MKTPKQLRRDIQDLSTHLAQVQAGLERRSSIKVAKIGKECQRSAVALAQLLQSQQVPTEYKVAVVGRFKAGKSSFVNELLPNRLASEGTLPETAAVTTFRHGQSVQAKVLFVKSAVWQDFKALYADNPKHVDAHRVRSWEGLLFKLGRGLDVYKPATGLAAHRPALRRVRASEIDVFVQPGHALASQSEVARA